jgi:DNA end-binding protein Ku
MASTVWKGFVSFGMVTIPVKLSVAARSESISFHQMHKPCGSRVNQQLVCKTCNRTVERAEIVKGYEEAKDKYLLIEPNEIEAIAPPSSTTMEIVQFVEAREVDPIYFESSYYLEPEKVGRVAYKLLVTAMRASERIAVAKLAMHQREHTVLIRPYGPGLSLNTMFYESEVRAQELNLSDVEIASEHLQLAGQLMTSMMKPFAPQEFRDEYQARLLEMLEAKRQGKPISITPARAAAPVVDILAALQQSLGRKPPAKAEAAVQTSAMPIPAETKSKRRTGTR